VATAAAEPQPVVPAIAPAAPPPSAPQAAVPLPGRLPQPGQQFAWAAAVPDRASHPVTPAARRPAGSVVAARHPIHRPASAMAQRQIPSYRPGGYPPPAVTYGYPGYYAHYVGYRPYAYYVRYRPYAYYRVY
jgi:hypothetical protein